MSRNLRLVGNVVRVLVITAVLAALGLFVCLPVGIGAYIGLADIPDQLNWKAHTSPLDQEIIQDICRKFQLPPGDTRCRPGAKTYAPDFFRLIRQTFAPRNSKWATYDEVQQKLGSYQFLYEPPVTTGQGLTYFVAHYDLQGDQVFPITMFFYADGRLWRLFANVGD
jgi:hypothetical protein